MKKKDNIIIIIIGLTGMGRETCLCTFHKEGKQGRELNQLRW